MKKVIVIGSIVALVGGGYLFYRQQIKNLQEMKYQFLKVSFSEIGKEKAVLNVSLRVTSDSTLEAQITNLHLDVFIDNVKVGSVTEQKPIIIPAKGSSIVELSVTIPVMNIATNLVGLAESFFTTKNNAIRISGNGIVKSAFISTKVPIQYDSTVKDLIS